MGYLGLILLFVLGVLLLTKPEKIWELDHLFTVKNGEPTELYLAFLRVLGALCVVISVAVAAFLLILAILG